VSGEAALLLGYPTILEGDAARLLARAGDHDDPESVGAIALRRSALRLDESGRLGGRVLSATLTPDVVRLRVLVDGLGEMHAVAPHDADVRIDHDVLLRVDMARTAVLPGPAPAHKTVSPVR
jgi:thiamine transport system ATP-binding protein